MNQEKKVQAIRKLLLKYTNPREEIEGINAWTIALMILHAIDDVTNQDPAILDSLDILNEDLAKLDKMLGEAIRREHLARKALSEARILLRNGKPSKAYAVIKEGLENV